MSVDQTMPANIVCPGIYRHYKGNRYEVIGNVRHSETREELTLYRALYGEHGIWVRPSAMFSEAVIVDGKSVPRFVKIDPELSASSNDCADSLETRAILPGQ